MVQMNYLEATKHTQRLIGEEEVENISPYSSFKPEKLNKKTEMQNNMHKFWSKGIEIMDLKRIKLTEKFRLHSFLIISLKPFL